jgi:hypothetical protein
VASYLENSQVQLVINKTADLPILRDLLLYQPAKSPKFGWLMLVWFPIGLLVYAFGRSSQKAFLHDIRHTVKVGDSLTELLQK